MPRMIKSHLPYPGVVSKSFLYISASNQGLYHTCYMLTQRKSKPFYCEGLLGIFNTE